MVLKNRLYRCQPKSRTYVSWNVKTIDLTQNQIIKLARNECLPQRKKPEHLLNKHKQRDLRHRVPLNRGNKQGRKQSIPWEDWVSKE